MKFIPEFSGILVLGLFCLLLTACAPATERGAVSAQNRPPSVAPFQPIEYQPDKTTGSRPDWLDRVPADRDGLHFQVGLGDLRQTQAEADEAALQAALVKIGAFVGVRITQIEEVVRKVSGQESGVLDGSVDATGTTNTAINVLVAGAKPSAFHRQKFRAMRGKDFMGEAYSSAVLVTIPLEEIKKAKDWIEREDKRSKDDLRNIIADHARRLETLEGVMAQGDVLRALHLLQGEWQRLDGLAGDFDQRGGPFAGQVGHIRDAQRSLIARAREVASAIHIDTGRVPPCLLPHGDGQSISVWAWTRHDGRYQPAARLPLLLRHNSGAILARAITGADGQADFPIAPNAPTGDIRVTIDTDATSLNGFSEPFLASLSRVEGYLTLTPLPGDLQGAVRGMVARLFTAPALAPPRVGKVILGPVTYGDSGQGSEFAYLLKQELSAYLTQVPGLMVVKPRFRNVAEVARALEERREAQVVNAPVTRGIGVLDTSASSAMKIAGADGTGMVVAPVTRGISLIGASATQALIDGADAALETVYRVRAGEVVLDLSLRQAASDILLRSVSAGVRRDSLPPGMELLPQPETAPSPPPTAQNRSIRLQVASHLGDGQTYAEGDTISYFVNLDRDAYLMLVYQDAAGHLIRILPNRLSDDGFYKAGSTLQIPTAKDPFEFTITPPFGNERVWAFAASVPLPKLPGDELESGLLLLHGSLSDLLGRVRTLAGKPGVYYGEAQTTITTVSGRRGIAAAR